MPRPRTSLMVAMAALLLSGGCGWWFSRGFLRQVAQSCAGFGR